jgi:nucleotide-binding universal stress UspA family protein
MSRAVVVPVDGSDFAEVALPMGRLLARLTGSELHLVHVLRTPAVNAFHPEDRLSLGARIHGQACAYVERLAAGERARGGAVAVGAVIADDRGVAQALSDYAARVDARWIVSTTHGAGGVSRLVMGSVAEGLSRSAATPLIFVRPWDVTGDMASAERRFRWILVPLDGSREAEAALPPAEELARATGASLALVRIVPAGPFAWAFGDAREAGAPSAATRSAAEAALYVERVAARVRERGVGTQSWVAANADPAAGILTAAVERNADAIVMSTHGRGAVGRALLGSVADEVLRKTTLPLALVRSEGRREHAGEGERSGAERPPAAAPGAGSR